MTANTSFEIKLANPRGFCAGVDRAIEIVERAIEEFGKPIYVRHEVVHNRFVVESLKKKGAVFVDELVEVPDGSTVIFSAHGVSKQVRQEADKRDLRVFDATCPLVTKVHMEVVRYCKQGREAILIGHRGHPEVEGTMGQWDSEAPNSIHLVESLQDVNKLTLNPSAQVSFITQTTLSVDDTEEIIAALEKKFPAIEGPKRDDICYATQNRQDAVKKLVIDCDLLLVIGSKTSSNSNRLREIAIKRGVESYLIDGPEQIQSDWLANRKSIGVTAGASAPELLVKRVVDHLRATGASNVSEVAGVAENIVFAAPKELRR